MLVDWELAPLMATSYSTVGSRGQSGTPNGDIVTVSVVVQSNI